MLLGTEAAEAFWTKANGDCQATPTVTKTGAVTTRYRGCAGGREVTAILLEGVGHQIPEDAVSLKFRLSEATFNFFARNSPTTP